MRRRNRSLRYLLTFLFLIGISWWLRQEAPTKQGNDSPAEISPFSGTCIKVHDGDTITIETGRPNSESYRIRLFGIDAPEQSQPHGKESRSITSRMVLDRTVRVEPLETDRYGRPVANVTVDGRDLALELVRAGAAWHYRHYSKDRDLAAAEQEARSRARGLWAEPDPVPPWEWRTRARE